MRSSQGVVVARYVPLTVLAALFLLPFYVLLRNAFSTPQQMAAAQWQ
jgi:multiple sugar transport system permease protein